MQNSMKNEHPRVLKCKEEEATLQLGLTVRENVKNEGGFHLLLLLFICLSEVGATKILISILSPSLFSLSPYSLLARIQSQSMKQTLSSS